MLKQGEIIRIITDYIEVHGGYLGDFSYRTLEEFFPAYCDIEIDWSKLEGATNRYRFQNYLEESDAETQLKILKGIFKKYPLEFFSKDVRPLKKLIYDDYQIIMKRLESYQPILSQEDIKAHFEKIQQELLEEINNAKYSIWVAVAWVTDKTIFNKLAHKKHQGLTVELILNDDSINRKSSLDYEKYLTTYWANPKDKLMHHKFCVIDLKTCITGSYNWTNNAKYRNLENITIKKNTQSVLDYADEFVKMKNTINKSKTRKKDST